MSVVPLLNMTGAPHDFALVATLVAQFCGAVCVTISQSTSYGAGGTMGPEFMNALEAGKGINYCRERCHERTLMNTVRARGMRVAKSSLC